MRVLDAARTLLHARRLWLQALTLRAPRQAAAARSRRWHLQSGWAPCTFQTTPGLPSCPPPQGHLGGACHVHQLHTDGGRLWAVPPRRLQLCHGAPHAHAPGAQGVACPRGSWWPAGGSHPWQPGRRVIVTAGVGRRNTDESVAKATRRLPALPQVMINCRDSGRPPTPLLRLTPQPLISHRWRRAWQSRSLPPASCWPLRASTTSPHARLPCGTMMLRWPSPPTTR